MLQKPLFILGLTYFGNHESAAVLLKDGAVIAASEEERFSRIKFDRSFPAHSIQFCLDYANIDINDIQHVGFFWQPWKGIPNRIFYAIQGLPASLLRGGKNGRVLFDLFSAERILRRKTGYSGSFHFLNHHLTHASSAFFASGFNKSAIVSIDGTGEEETCWLGSAKGNTFTNYKKAVWPHSLGHLYGALTQYLGFNIFQDEYKVMGLTAYGKPEYLEEFRNIIKLDSENIFTLDLSYVDYQYFKTRWYSEKWLKKFGPNRLPHQLITQTHKNIAASLQARLEEVLYELSAYALEKSQSNNLCFSGGVALNALAIGNISKKLGIPIFTNSASGDPRCALGAAYYIDQVILGNKRSNTKIENVFWGKDFSEREIEEVLVQRGLPYQFLENPARTAAQLISQGKVIGWFQGRTEFGQRALGNRSILADPRQPFMKDRINGKIKNRESFRPFAPAILQEFQTQYFDWPHSVPFMTQVHPIRKEKVASIPAVAHIDGSARLQTITKKDNPLFYSLIDHFLKITGTPLVLNTSFNASGEPIVNSPADAISTFFATGLDFLIIGKYLISR